MKKTVSETAVIICCLAVLLPTGCATMPPPPIIAGTVPETASQTGHADQTEYLLKIRQQNQFSPAFVSIWQPVAGSEDLILMAEYNSNRHFLFVVSELFETEDENLNQVVFGSIAELEKNGSIADCHTWIISRKCLQDVRSEFLIWPKDF